MKWTEITGVDKDVDFKIKGLDETYRIVEQPTGYQRVALALPTGELTGVSEWVYDEIINSSPAGIIRLPPPLTDEQRAVLMALYTLGYRWVTRDKYGSVYVHEELQYKKTQNSWLMRLLITKPTNFLESLVTYPDPEPFDIGKALGVTK